jgi:hypothetical protein
MKTYIMIVLLTLALLLGINSVAATWISPTGHNDPGNEWSNEANAYDDNEATVASVTGIPGQNWSSFLYFTHSTITDSNGIRFCLRGPPTPVVNSVDVDVHDQGTGTWIDVYEGLPSWGSFASCDGGWKEHTFPESDVDQARIRLYELGINPSATVYLFEFDFGSGIPTTTTTSSSTTTTIPSVPEFGSIGVAIMILLIAPTMAYLIARKFGGC